MMHRYGPDDDTLAFELSNVDHTSWKRRSSQTLRSSASSISEPEPLSSPSWRSRLPHSRVLRKVFYILPLLLSVGILVLLAALSPHFSRQLDANSCLPTGEWALPGTTSIWSAANFFTITLGFRPPTPLNCNDDSSDVTTLACVGFTFTQAKVIDVIWDVVVGRGGQLILIAVSYRVFREVLKSLMESGEVGYDMFSAVSFHTGGFQSLGPLITHALGQTPIPRTRKAMVLYWMMLLASIYVIASETLVSAMTGYTSVYAPFLNYDPYRSTKGLVDCGDSFIPIWGRIGPSFAIDDQFDMYGYGMIGFQEKSNSYTVLESAWIDYYYRYRDEIYDSCPRQLNITSCPASQTKTFLHTAYSKWEAPYPDVGPWQRTQSGGIKTIPGPAPGILPFANDTTSLPYTYKFYACGSSAISLTNLTNIPNTYNQEATAICRAGSGYAWGFSFLLTFVVCILNLCFVLTMYGLWFGSRRHRSEEDGGSNELKDAVNMVTAAQRQYGNQISGWNAASLKTGVLKGYIGMGDVEDGGSDEVVKRRKKREIVGGVAVIRD